eukprot:3046016-Rhodomonas_salina.1
MGPRLSGTGASRLRVVLGISVQRIPEPHPLAYVPMLASYFPVVASTLMSHNGKQLFPGNTHSRSTALCTDGTNK